MTARVWTHEQDNTNVVRRDGAADRTLVREFGFAEYRRIDNAALAPRPLQLSRTAEFWAQVCALRDEMLAAPSALVPDDRVGDEAMSNALIAQAKNSLRGRTRRISSGGRVTCGPRVAPPRAACRCAQRPAVRGPSGRRHSQNATSAMITIGSQCTQTLGASHQRITAHSAMVTLAVHLARRLTAPWRAQLSINGPNWACARSYASSRSGPRGAANAASSTSGVVGRPGTTTPIKPSTNATQASAHRKVAGSPPTTAAPALAARVARSPAHRLAHAR